MLHNTISCKTSFIEEFMHKTWVRKLQNVILEVTAYWDVLLVCVSLSNSMCLEVFLLVILDSSVLPFNNLYEGYISHMNLLAHNIVFTAMTKYFFYVAT